MYPNKYLLDKHNIGRPLACLKLYLSLNTMLVGQVKNSRQSNVCAMTIQKWLISALIPSLLCYDCTLCKTKQVDQAVNPS